MSEEERRVNKRPRIATNGAMIHSPGSSGDQRSFGKGTNSIAGGSSSPTPSSTHATTSGDPPCAACKSLRRKCTRDCIFLPYFPRDDPEKFARVHKVFGASNVAKMLQELPLQQREDAVASLEYEAQARVQDPVYGCVGILCVLQRQVAALKAQLAIAERRNGVKQELDFVSHNLDASLKTEPISPQRNTPTVVSHPEQLIASNMTGQSLLGNSDMVDLVMQSNVLSQTLMANPQLSEFLCQNNMMQQVIGSSQGNIDNSHHHLDQ